MSTTVPCPCLLCKGKLVTQHIRRKHSSFNISANVNFDICDHSSVSSTDGKNDNEGVLEEVDQTTTNISGTEHMHGASLLPSAVIIPMPNCADHDHVTSDQEFSNDGTIVHIQLVS